MAEADRDLGACKRDLPQTAKGRPGPLVGAPSLAEARHARFNAARDSPTAVDTRATSSSAWPPGIERDRAVCKVLAVCTASSYMRGRLGGAATSRSRAADTAVKVAAAPVGRQPACVGGAGLSPARMLPAF